MSSGGMAHLTALLLATAVGGGVVWARAWWEARDDDFDTDGDDIKIDNPSPPPPRGARNRRRTGETAEEGGEEFGYSPTERYSQSRIVPRDSGGWRVVYPGDADYDDYDADGNPVDRNRTPVRSTSAWARDVAAMRERGFATAEIVQMLMREHGLRLRAAWRAARKGE